MLTRMIRGRAARRDEGFTVLELTIVLAILSLVLTVMGSVLLSVTKAANRGEALVANEQRSTLALTQLARDLRAAVPIGTAAQPGALVTYPSTYTTTEYQHRIQMLLVNPSGGPATAVQWVYDSTAKTLSRQVLTGANGTVTQSAVVLSNVVNTAGQPVFSYYDDNGNDMVAANNLDNLADCTTKVRIFVSNLSDPGPLPFNETKDVQLENQIINLQENGGICS